MSFAVDVRSAANGDPSQNFPSTPLWTVPVSAKPVGSPVAAGDRLFVPLQSEVSARRLADGGEIWNVKLDVDGPLAVSSDRLVVTSKGVVRALNVATGEAVWSDSPGPVTAPALVHEHVLLIAVGEQLIAYNVTDGTKLWTSDVGVVEQRPALKDGRVYVPTADGRLVALEVSSGKPVWEYHVGIKPSEPLAYGDRVLIGSARKHFCSVKALDGEEDWCALVGAVVIGGAVADTARVYFVAFDNLLYARDRRNGALRWKADLGYRPSGGPALVGTTVSAPGKSARLQGFDVATGKPAGQLTLAEELAAVPAFIVSPDSPPRLAALAGGLQNQWTLTLAVPAPPGPPSPRVEPLTALPGLAVPVGAPPTRPGLPPQAGVRPLRYDPASAPKTTAG
jgi:outer membrane protein assembly factor BamB